MSAAHLGAAEPATPPPPGMPAGEEEETPAVVADDEQPRPKPYADATGVFAKLIKLLPLATDDEAATFERRARRFTRRLGPLSLGRLVDDRRRPILWYACDSDDHAALEILLDQGCALSAFVPIDDGPSPYEHAHRLGHARIAETLKGWAHRELADVMDDGPAAQRARHEEARALLRRPKRRDDSLTAVCGGGWAC